MNQKSPANSSSADENRPAGVTTTNAAERLEFGELIFEYSRSQAIAEGVLVDVSALAREAGFLFPVAMTEAAWETCVRVPDGVEGQDETGRLWDVLFVLRFAIKSNPDRSEIRFCVDVADERAHVSRIKLKCLCGPGDDAAPVLTIMQPEED